jgi:hypothetical protein
MSLTKLTLAGITVVKLFPARESLVSDMIPAEDGKIANLFLQCTIHVHISKIIHSMKIYFNTRWTLRSSMNYSVYVYKFVICLSENLLLLFQLFLCQVGLNLLVFALDTVTHLNDTSTCSLITVGREQDKKASRPRTTTKKISVYGSLCVSANGK